MAKLDKSTVDSFIDKLRGCNAVMRKLASLQFSRYRARRRLKREWDNLYDEAYDEAVKLEERSQRAICADDLIDLGGIICRTTNTPQETFYEVLALLGIEVQARE